MILTNLLAAVGGAVIGIILYQIAKEAFRAIRQGRRLAAVAARVSGQPRGTLRTWVKASFGEMFASYSTLVIGVWALPYNPGKPIRRAFYWSSY